MEPQILSSSFLGPRHNGNPNFWKPSYGTEDYHGIRSRGVIEDIQGVLGVIFVLGILWSSI